MIILKTSEIEPYAQNCFLYEHFETTDKEQPNFNIYFTLGFLHNILF